MLPFICHVFVQLGLAVQSVWTVSAICFLVTSPVLTDENAIGAQEAYTRTPDFKRFLIYSDLCHFEKRSICIFHGFLQKTLFTKKLSEMKNCQLATAAFLTCSFLKGSKLSIFQFKNFFIPSIFALSNFNVTNLVVRLLQPTR